MVAATGGHIKITLLFLDKGARWNMKSKAAGVGVKLGKKEVAQQLREAGTSR